MEPSRHVCIRVCARPEPCMSVRDWCTFHEYQNWLCRLRVLLKLKNWKKTGKQRNRVCFFCCCCWNSVEHRARETFLTHVWPKCSLQSRTFIAKMRANTYSILIFRITENAFEMYAVFGASSLHGKEIAQLWWGQFGCRYLCAIAFFVCIINSTTITNWCNRPVAPIGKSMRLGSGLCPIGRVSALWSLLGCHQQKVLL